MEQFRKYTTALGRNIYILMILGIAWVYLQTTGVLTQQLRIVLGLVTGAIILIALATEWRQPISEERAKEIAHERTVQFRKEGNLPQASFFVLPEAALRLKTIAGEQTVPESWDVCVEFEDDKHTQFVFRLHPFTGAIQKIFETVGWSAQKEPDKIIVEPPDYVSYMRMKKEIETKYGEPKDDSK